MIQTIEATIDEQRTVRLLEKVRVPGVRRALVTIQEDEPAGAFEAALLGEPALAEGWNRPEEDAAWSHLRST
ncbi:MAG: hypothetical protein HY300_20635 [Verrucomicrobia bacterium]|nr:hypothetical protein [Verrucomicrobiota bacterium]